MTSYDTRPLATAGALDDDDDDDDDVAAGDGRGNWGTAADSATVPSAAGEGTKSGPEMM